MHRNCICKHERELGSSTSHLSTSLGLTSPKGWYKLLRKLDNLRPIILWKMHQYCEGQILKWHFTSRPDKILDGPDGTIDETTCDPYIFCQHDLTANRKGKHLLKISRILCASFAASPPSWYISYHWRWTVILLRSRTQAAGRTYRYLILVSY